MTRKKYKIDYKIQQHINSKFEEWIEEHFDPEDAIEAKENVDTWIDFCIEEYLGPWKN